MTKMVLTPAQRRVLDRLATLADQGPGWANADDLGAQLRTLYILNEYQLLEHKTAKPYPAFPEVTILWRLKS